MTAPLTERQWRILIFIAEHVEATGYPPTVRQIAEHVGLKSTSSTHHHLIKLEEKGYLARDPHRARALIVKDPR